MGFTESIAEGDDREGVDFMYGIRIELLLAPPGIVVWKSRGRLWHGRKSTRPAAQAGCSQWTWFPTVSGGGRAKLPLHFRKNICATGVYQTHELDQWQTVAFSIAQFSALCWEQRGDSFPLHAEFFCSPEGPFYLSYIRDPQTSVASFLFWSSHGADFGSGKKGFWRLVKPCGMWDPLVPQL